MFLINIFERNLLIVVKMYEKVSMHNIETIVTGDGIRYIFHYYLRYCVGCMVRTLRNVI